MIILIFFPMNPYKEILIFLWSCSNFNKMHIHTQLRILAFVSLFDHYNAKTWHSCHLGYIPESREKNYNFTADSSFSVLITTFTRELLVVAHPDGLS